MESSGFKEVFDLCPTGIVITNHQLIIQDANAAAHRILRVKSLIGVSLGVLFDEVSKLHMETFSHYIKSGKQISLDCRFKNQNLEGWCELSATKVNSEEASNDTIIWSIADISMHKHRESELESLAYYDGLTGVYARHYFLHLAEQHMLNLRVNNQPFCLLVVDLDKFKQINDQYGHSKGDEILQKFASVTKDKLRKSDLLGRIGGEEFVLLLPGANETVSLRIANRICHEITTISQQPKVTVSIGIALVSEPKDSIMQAMKRADDALYAVKSNGRNHARLGKHFHPV